MFLYLIGERNNRNYLKRYHLFILLTAKVGEEIYACNCGPACQCGTLSTAPGKCTCDKEMVKAKVVKVEEGKVVPWLRAGTRREHSRRKGNMFLIVHPGVREPVSARIPANVFSGCIRWNSFLLYHQIP